MSSRYYHIGGISPGNSETSSAKNFEGRLQQLVINGERVLDEAHLKQIEYEGLVLFISEKFMKKKFFRECEIPAYGGLSLSPRVVYIPPYVSGDASAKSIQHYRHLFPNKDLGGGWSDNV